MGLGDSAMTVVAILLAAILMFVFPLMMTADNNEDVTNLKVEQLTTDFTDTMRVTGKLTQEDYDNFVVNLAATGNAYDVQIEVQRLDENLAKYRIRTGSISRNKKIKLIKHHYILYRYGEHRGIMASSILTLRNLFFGVIKKIFY